jgi:hypothetical protein
VDLLFFSVILSGDSARESSGFENLRILLFSFGCFLSILKFLFSHPVSLRSFPGGIGVVHVNGRE